MGYNKADLGSFKEKLYANEYKNITGARRAIGKCSGMTEDDKEKARSLANKHFGESAAPSKPAKVKKKKKEIVKRDVPAKKARVKKPEREQTRVVKKASTEQPTGSGDVKRGSKLSDIHREAATAGMLLEQFKTVKSLDPNMDIGEGLNLIRDTMLSVTRELRELRGVAPVREAVKTNGALKKAEESKPVEDAPPAPPLKGLPPGLASLPGAPRS